MPLRDFDPLVQEWFRVRFGAATEPQTLGWPQIRCGRDVLISAPTGSGKTLAAFLICLDRLVRAALESRAEAVLLELLAANVTATSAGAESPGDQYAAAAARWR